MYSKHDIYNYVGEKIVDAGTQLATLTTGADGSVVSDKKLPLMSELYTKTASAETAEVQLRQQALRRQQDCHLYHHSRK